MVFSNSRGYQPPRPTKSIPAFSVPYALEKLATIFSTQKNIQATWKSRKNWTFCLGHHYDKIITQALIGTFQHIMSMLWFSMLSSAFSLGYDKGPVRIWVPVRAYRKGTVSFSISYFVVDSILSSYNLRHQIPNFLIHLQAPTLQKCHHNLNKIRRSLFT